MSRRRGPLVPESQEGLDKFKEQVSNELGVEVAYGSPDKRWGYVPAHRCGEVGGNMVKKMIESYEKRLVK